MSAIFDQFSEDHSQILTKVEDLSPNDYVNLEDETIWNDDEFGELENPNSVNIIDAFFEREDEDGQGIWHVIVENSEGKEVILEVFSTHRFYVITEN